jgi:hypothetical protein
MTLATYSDLQGAVANWLHSADLTTYIPDFITLADGRINNDLRHQGDGDSTGNDHRRRGHLGPDELYRVEGRLHLECISPYVNLDRKTANWIYDKYPVRVATATPKFMAREGHELHLRAIPRL